MDDSELRIEIAIRAALMAKAALELVNLEPSLVSQQLDCVARQMRELEDKLKKAGLA